MLGRVVPLISGHDLCNEVDLELSLRCEENVLGVELTEGLLSLVGVLKCIEDLERVVFDERFG